MLAGAIVANLTLNVKNMSGRKRKELDLDARLPELPLRKRQDIRTTVEALNIPKSTLHDRLKEGVGIRAHTNSLRLLLTDANKRNRLEFCLFSLDPVTLVDGRPPKFQSMMDTIHIDE